MLSTLRFRLESRTLKLVYMPLCLVVQVYLCALNISIRISDWVQHMTASTTHALDSRVTLWVQNRRRTCTTCTASPHAVCKRWGTFSPTPHSECFCCHKEHWFKPILMDLFQSPAQFKQKMFFLFCLHNVKHPQSLQKSNNIHFSKESAGDNRFDQSGDNCSILSPDMKTNFYLRALPLLDKTSEQNLMFFVLFWPFCHFCVSDDQRTAWRTTLLSVTTILASTVYHLGSCTHHMSNAATRMVGRLSTAQYVSQPQKTPNRRRHAYLSKPDWGMQAICMFSFGQLYPPHEQYTAARVWLYS